MTNSAVILLLSDARGVYIPRDFVQSFDMKEWHIDKRYDIKGSDFDINLFNYLIGVGQ